MNDFGEQKKKRSPRFYVTIALVIVAVILFYKEASFVSKTKITRGRTDGHGHVIERKDSVVDK